MDSAFWRLGEWSKPHCYTQGEVPAGGGHPARGLGPVQERIQTHPESESHFILNFIREWITLCRQVWSPLRDTETEREPESDSEGQTERPGSGAGTESHLSSIPREGLSSLVYVIILITTVPSLASTALQHTLVSGMSSWAAPAAITARSRWWRRRTLGQREGTPRQ